VCLRTSKNEAPNIVNSRHNHDLKRNAPYGIEIFVTHIANKFMLKCKYVVKELIISRSSFRRNSQGHIIDIIPRDLIDHRRKNMSNIDTRIIIWSFV